MFASNPKSHGCVFLLSVVVVVVVVVVWCCTTLDAGESKKKHGKSISPASRWHDANATLTRAPALLIQNPALQIGDLSGFESEPVDCFAANRCDNLEDNPTY